jgi:hypothetical protein
MVQSDVSAKAHAYVIVSVHIPESAQPPSINEVSAAFDREQRAEFGLNDGTSTSRLHPSRTVQYEIPIT